MKLIKIIYIIFAAIIALTGCSPINHGQIDYSSNKQQNNNDNLNDYHENVPIGNANAEDFPVEVPHINPSEFSFIGEAENGELSGGLYISEERKGFSGDGYVSGFSKKYENKIRVPIEIQTPQHYDITLCIAADSSVKNALLVNGKKVGDFEIKDSEINKFIKATFYGVFLEAGIVEISVSEIDGNFDLDYIEVTNNKNLEEISYDISPKLCNENATQSTKDLMQYLTDNYGKAIITGQYASSDKNLELEIIYEITEQYPAIRFGDIRGYSLNGQQKTNETEACISWAKRGGIVGLMWYWNAPIGRASVYEASSDFDLSKAIDYNNDVAMLNLTELNNLYKKGEISKECLAILKDIDAISEQLKILQENDIPVLWRPLHEAGGGWFWWGAAGPEAYQWLWGVLYSRMTYYHKLNNLIWIWNGQDSEYTISSNLYDIAALDIYLNDTTDFGSRVEQYQWLNNITNSKKLLAISECGIVPNIDNMFRDKSMWSFFGLWYGEYIMDYEGKFSDDYNTAEMLKKVYNSEGSINLYKYIHRDQISFDDE